MDKSYVTMEQKVCIVCGQTYDTNALLLDQRLRQRFDRHTVTGWGMCTEHQKLKDDGYIALIGCDETKMEASNNNIQPEDAYRTGEIAHIRADAFPRIFNSQPPTHGVVFCDREVILILQKKMPKSTQVNISGFNALKK